MTPELRQARCGLLTASNAAKFMGKLDTDGLESACRDIAWERVYGVEDDDEPQQWQSEAMKRGAALEADAIAWYEFHTGHEVDADPNRCIPHVFPALAGIVGASPEGLVRAINATLEVKVPLHKAWMDVLRRQEVPAEYRWQCRWQVWATGSDHAEFLCWHPRPRRGVIVQLRVTDEEAKAMHQRALLVNERVEEWCEILRRHEAVAA